MEKTVTETVIRSCVTPGFLVWVHTCRVCDFQRTSCCYGFCRKYSHFSGGFTDFLSGGVRVHACVCVCARVYVCVCVRARVCMYVCVRVCMYVRMYVCVCVRARARACVCMYVCM